MSSKRTGKRDERTAIPETLGNPLVSTRDGPGNCSGSENHDRTVRLALLLESVVRLETERPDLVPAFVVLVRGVTGVDAAKRATGTTRRTGRPGAGK